MAEPLPPLGDSAFSASAFERHLDERAPTRWVGWRLRLLVALALLACLSLFGLLRWAAGSPHLDLRVHALSDGSLTVGAADAAPDIAGRTLQALSGADGRPVELDALVLQPSPRWQVDDARRERQVEQHERLAGLLAASPDGVRLHFDDGSTQRVAVTPRGLSGLGLLFWPLAALALALAVVGTASLLARPQMRNALFALMALCQAGNLLFIALQSGRGLGLPVGAATGDLLLRTGFDLVTAAAAVHAFSLHPRRLPGADVIAGATWTGVLLLLVLAQAGALPQVWWWTQSALLLLGGAALALATWSTRLEANPFAAALRRLGLAALATLTLVTLGVAAAAGEPGVPLTVAAFGATVWYVFFASLLLLVPFLSRSRQLLREFVMLAGISTVATSLDLLFVAAFSFGAFTSLALAVFIALGLYAGARQWLLNQILGSSPMTTERTFEQLYRTAREVQEQPARYPALLTKLLRELFEPLEVLRVERPAAGARVIASGSALVVPVRRGTVDDAARPPLSLVLRFARRGQRLFTADDARLADRVVEQLRRAVAYDQAVERGRNEERLRIAQDLHDDIGARLLTLMYQAQTPEMEDYIRNTLKDLKTLTRGLAASEHRLSHAAAEWKTDLTQRLTAAHVQLGWSFEYDRDVRLSMAQWSALTRVLRELVSNALHHAQASRVDVSFILAGSMLALSVADDGQGRAPESWSHGLGLGGVRKRVKLLGGTVRWRENSPRGIVCEVRVAEFAATE